MVEMLVIIVVTFLECHGAAPPCPTSAQLLACSGLQAARHQASGRPAWVGWLANVPTAGVNEPQETSAQESK